MVKGGKRSNQSTTIGIWVGEEETLVDDFDDQLGHYPSYSRSKRIKDAMRLYMAVEDALEQGHLDFDREIEKRMWIRQAVLDRQRNEIETDASPARGMNPSNSE